MIVHIRIENALETVFPGLRHDALLIAGKQPDETVYGVGNGMLAGVVVAHPEFTKQAYGQQLDA